MAANSFPSLDTRCSRFCYQMVQKMPETVHQTVHRIHCSS